MNNVRLQGPRFRAAKLAAAATGLKRRRGAGAPFCLAFLTDRKRIAQPLAIIRALPAGSAVILRDYDMPKRASFAAQAQSVCARRGLFLFIGADARLAEKIGASGVHWPSWGARRASGGALLITAACHSAEDLDEAYRDGANLAFLSPVFLSDSHPGAPALGPARFRRLAAAAALPVLALGGVDEQNAGLLAAPNVAGFGAIGAFAQ